MDRRSALKLFGTAAVAGALGVPAAGFAAEKRMVTVVKIDFARVEEVRRNWPFLRDRRIDAYGGLTSRFLSDDPR